VGVDIPYLRQFVVLAHELHFGRAAEKLGTAQPTLSQQIIALECDLGVRLFERNKRKVVLTDAGALLLREADGLLRSLSMTAERVREAACGRRGMLKIGSSSPAIGTLLPRVIGSFRHEYPQVELSMEILHSRQLFEGLQERRLHVAFARAGMSATGVSSRRLWEQPYRVVLPEGHPQAQRETVLLRDLQREPLITMSRRLLDGSYDRLLAFCRSEGYTPRSVKEADRYDSVIGLVACRLGITIMPDAIETRSNGVISKRIALTEASDLSTLWTSVYWNDDERSLILAAFLARTFEQSGTDIDLEQATTP
jgi:DNA-binding transcriptional LysR family regulator